MSDQPGYPGVAGAAQSTAPTSQSSRVELPMASCAKCGSPVRPWNLTAVKGWQLCPDCAKATKRASSIKVVVVALLALVVVGAVANAWIARVRYLTGPERSLTIVRLAAKAESRKHLEKYIGQGARDDLNVAIEAQRVAAGPAGLKTIGTSMYAAAWVNAALQSIELVDYEEDTGRARGLVADSTGKPAFAIEFELAKVGQGTDAYWQVSGISNAAAYVAWVGANAEL